MGSRDWYDPLEPNEAIFEDEDSENDSDWDYYDEVLGNGYVRNGGPPTPPGMMKIKDMIKMGFIAIPP